MRREDVLSVLRTHEIELRAAGVRSISLFGSLARGQARDDSDIDVAVDLDRKRLESGFAYFQTVADLQSRLAVLLGRPVDVVVEPVLRKSLREALEQDRLVAF